ncbi:MAG TPA: hypothetical protein PKZ20_10210 [Rhodocyclaceae bacterium]|nr:hypothetical protein [Rhodocyclaceae bacterium]
MKTYQVKITGKTPLLMHPDDIDWADRMDAWKNDPANKAKSKAGDDRTPPWRWIGNLYHDGNVVVMPQENIMKSIAQGAAMVPTGRGQKTFKEQSQSGIMSPSMGWPLRSRGQVIATADVFKLLNDDISFADQKLAAERLGFGLHVRRAKIGTAKHVRVRPIFREWELQGELCVLDAAITERVLQDILSYAGTYKGLGDWRPGCSTPGQYGVYAAEIKAV